MKSKVVEQVEELLKEVEAVEDIAKIERIVAEAKGRIQLEPTAGFWEGKRPCWEMCQCPEKMRSECPAPKYQSFPCWQIEGTYHKLGDYGASGTDLSICEACRVYKRWGQNKPIEIKLFGKGLNASKVREETLPEIEEATEMTRWMCSECGYIVFNSPNGRPGKNLPPLKCPGCGQESAFMDVTCYAPGRGPVGSIDMQLVGRYLNAKRMRKALV